MAFDPYPPKTQTQGPQAPGAPVASIFFDRKELSAILSLYGRMVAGGHWRDYGIDASREAVSFCVFRRASEAPLYRIEKRPALARKQGAWAVIAQGGLVMKRAHELDQVLKVFDRARFAVVK
jgi:hypothetical protein